MIHLDAHVWCDEVVFGEVTVSVSFIPSLKHLKWELWIQHRQTDTVLCRFCTGRVAAVVKHFSGPTSGVSGCIYLEM